MKPNTLAYTYILASQRNGTLYIGVTSDLHRRTNEHKHSTGAHFTGKHHVSRLVYYEVHDRIEDAIVREKQLKKWNRKWKLELIENRNPNWLDLYDEIG